MKKIEVVLFVFYLSSISLQAQIRATGFYNIDVTKNFCDRIEQRNLSSQQSYQIIAEILGPTGLKYKGRILECEDFGGKVCAFIENGTQWIVYDAAFLRNVQSSSNWSAKGILAHELAHHLQGHTMDHVYNLSFARLEELEADY